MRTLDQIRRTITAIIAIRVAPTGERARALFSTPFVRDCQLGAFTQKVAINRVPAGRRKAYLGKSRGRRHKIAASLVAHFGT